MSSAKDLGKSFKPEHRKPRRLTEAPRQEITTKTAEKFDRAIDLRTRAEKVLTKTDKLLDMASKIAITRAVPVSKDARAVRSAVLRKAPETGGAFINLGLYVSALDYLEDEREVLNEDLIANLPGDAATAASVLEISRNQKMEGLSGSDAAYIASQLFILVMFKLLNKGIDNIDTQLQTGGKQPAGTEAGAVVLAIAISIVTQLLVTDMLQEEIEDDISGQPGYENVDPTAIEEAKTAAVDALEKIRAFRLLKAAKSPGDYRLIVDYVQAFLAEVKDPGWEEWMLIPDIKATGYQISAIVDTMYRTVPTWTPESIEPPEEGLEKDLEFLWGPNSPLGNFEAHNQFQAGQGTHKEYLPAPPSGVMDVVESQIDASNDLVDKIAAVLSWSETQDSICCLVRILGGVDLTFVRSIRALLDGAMAGFSADLNFQATGYMHQSFSLGRKAATNLMWDLSAAYDDFADQLWAYITEDETVKLAAACGPLDEIFTYATDWLGGFLDRISRFVLKYVDVLVVTNNTFLKRLNGVGNLKRLRRYAATIDLILSAVDRGELCQPDGTQGPSDAEVSKIASDILGGLPTLMSVPVEGQEDPYVTFTLSEPLEFDNGIRITEIRQQEDAADSPDRDVCRRRMSGQDLTQFNEFVRKIHGT